MMQITFENMEQKDQVINSLCVDDLYIKRDIPCTENCEECWHRFVEIDFDED